MSSILLSHVPSSLLKWLEAQAKQKDVSIEEQALQMLLDIANTDQERPYVHQDAFDALTAWREDFYQVDEDDSEQDFINPFEHVRSSSTGQKNPWHP